VCAPRPLFNQRGKPFPLLRRLARLRKAGLAAWPVWIKSGAAWIAGRACAIRKGQNAIHRAQRRLTLKEQTGKTVSPIVRHYAEYELIFTTLPGTDASVEQVLEAYRLRWQVELTFKGLKSIAPIAHVPSAANRVAELGYTASCSSPYAARG
jgi:Transposase DDE domain